MHTTPLEHCACATVLQIRPALGGVSSLKTTCAEQRSSALLPQGVDLIKHAEQIGRQMAGPKSLPPMEAIAHERQMTLLMALYFKVVQLTLCTGRS